LPTLGKRIGCVGNRLARPVGKPFGKPHVLAAAIRDRQGQEQELARPQAVAMRDQIRLDRPLRAATAGSRPRTADRQWPDLVAEMLARRGSAIAEMVADATGSDDAVGASVQHS
jgi:hypothetical protein